MVATVTCQALLVLYLMDLVLRCNGYHRQRPQIISKALPKWKLRCSESIGTPPTSTPSKRSSMNEKMLEKAKKLRDEALELEGMSYNSTVAEIKVDTAQASSSTVKTSRDEFVSRFPVERLTANTSIFTLGAFVTNTTKVPEVSNGTYVSVLVERTSDRANQKLQLDKLSGEVIRRKNLENGIPEVLSKGPAVALEVKKILTEIVPLGKKKENPAKEFIIDRTSDRMSNRTALFNALDAVSNSKVSVSTAALQNCLREVVGSDGESKYELVDPFQQDGDFSFWPANLLFKFLSWLMFIDVDLNLPENKADLKYLESAFMSNIRDLTTVEKDDTNTDRFTALLEDLGRRQFQLRADFLKALVTGEVPSVDELEGLISRTTPAREADGNQDELTLWRKATITRLQSTTKDAAMERKLLWGILPEKNSSSIKTVSVYEPVVVGTSPFNYPEFAPYPPTAESIAANAAAAAAAAATVAAATAAATALMESRYMDESEDYEGEDEEEALSALFASFQGEDDDAPEDGDPIPFIEDTAEKEAFLKSMAEKDALLVERLTRYIGDADDSDQDGDISEDLEKGLQEMMKRIEMGPIGPELQNFFKNVVMKRLGMDAADWSDGSTLDDLISEVIGPELMNPEVISPEAISPEVISPEAISQMPAIVESSKNETKTIKDLTKMSFEEAVDFLKLDEDVKFPDSIEKYMKLANELVTENFADTAAERFIVEYFDMDSWRDGLVISREGAGRFQLEMLNELFVVTSVEMSHGAFIYNGRYKTKTPNEFALKLSERYAASRMSDEVGYTVMMNERYPTLEGGVEQAALDQLLGRGPSIVVFPKTWTSTPAAASKVSLRTFLKSSLASLAAVSSAAFAASCLDMFNPASTFMTTGVVPDDFLPLAFMPLSIQYTSALAETIVGNIKGFNVTTLVVPAFSLPTFGTRSIYTSMPKNRNDIFDAAASGVIVALVSSLVAMYIGLQITADSPAEVVAGFPSMSLALLNTNAVVTQFLNYQLPEAAVLAREVAATTVGITADSSTVHLHWLAIAGAVSFIANTLQLIPVDNSAGSKLSLTVIGKEPFTLVAIFTGAIKFLFVLPMLFTINALSVVTTPRLLFDYFVTSQIFGSEEESQVAKDNLTEVSEGRRIVLLGLVTLFFFALVPYEDVGHRLISSLSSAAEYVRVIATTGALPIENNLF